MWKKKKVHIVTYFPCQQHKEPFLLPLHRKMLSFRGGSLERVSILPASFDKFLKTPLLPLKKDC